jgi:membrane fusion protein, multidrug efflux system
MQPTIKHLSLAVLVSVAAACGSGSAKTELDLKKEDLKKTKEQYTALAEKIQTLEKDILKADPASATEKPKLVTLTKIEPGQFDHFIDLQGTVDALNVVYVAPRGQGGVVKAIHVKNGSKVNKGQLILQLDNALARQQVVAAEQQISGIQAQLDQAKSILERQQNLWKQNIGTEVQVLNAKTNVSALESQLQSALANVRLAKEQSGQSNVYAEIGGIVDQVNIKIGEFFSPQSAAMPGTGIRIVNSSNLKVKVMIPENYLGKVKEGTKLLVNFPETNKTITATVNVASKFIDEISRSFTIEAKLPNDKDLHPNQIAVVKIQDYSAPNVITIPINLVQTDDKGKFVMVALPKGDKLVAGKKSITTGQIYGDKMEAKTGLEQGEALITDGYQNLYEGQLITTSVQK